MRMRELHESSWGASSMDMSSGSSKMEGMRLLRAEVSTLMMDLRGMVKRVVSAGMSEVATDFC